MKQAKRAVVHLSGKSGNNAMLLRYGMGGGPLERGDAEPGDGMNGRRVVEK
jgi:hypothetical protein